jgi:CheY-like chemotaxis protein
MHRTYGSGGRNASGLARIQWTQAVRASTQPRAKQYVVALMAMPGKMRDHVGVRRTVLIVDDHPSFRAMATMLLDAEGFEVVGEAADGASALLAADRLRPDVVLLDVQLPNVDGFTVAKQLTDAGFCAEVVLISSREAVTYGTRLAASPAKGFIAKRELSGAALADALQ